jgi:hypothetical protein
MRQANLKNMTITILVFIAILLGVLVARVGYFNATGDTWIKILTGTVGGLAAALALLSAGLKEENGRDLFTIFVPIDEKTYQLARPKAPNTTASVTGQIYEYCYSAIIIDGKEVEIVPPSDQTSVVGMLADGLQCRIVSEIEKLNSKQTPINYQVRENGMTVIPPSSRLDWPEDLTDVPFSKLLSLLQNPQISKNPVEKMMWETALDRQLRLPENSKLEISSVGDNRFITIKKSNYFVLNIKIEFAGNYPQLPLGIEVNNPNDCSSYAFSIDCDYHFEELTASSPKTEQYKRWMKWLVSSLKERNTVYLQIPPGAKEILELNKY